MPKAPRGLILFFVIMWLGLGLLCGGMGAVGAVRHYTLQSQCTMTVTAFPQNVETSTKTVYRNRSYVKRYLYTVEYLIAANGESYRVTHKFEESGKPQNDYAKPVTVKADSKDPTRFFWDDDNMALIWFLMLFGICMTGGSGYIAYVNREKLRKD